MDHPHDPAAAGAAAMRSFSGRAAYREAWCTAVRQMAEQAHTHVWWVDPDFADWPLDDAQVLAALAAWARPGRSLTLLAGHFDDMPRHPRFVAWRRVHAHLVQGRAVTVEASRIPTLLLGPVGQGLQRLDAVRSSGRWLDDPATWQAWREVVDALMQQSEAAFPAFHLGL